MLRHTGFLACGGMVVGQRGQRLVGDYSERACADFRGLPTVHLHTGFLACGRRLPKFFFRNRPSPWG